MKNELCKNAGFITEDELVELVDTNAINGGTAAAVGAAAGVVAAGCAVAALFTVTSACTKDC